MELKWILDADQSDQSHGQVGGLEDVGEEHVEHDPTGAVGGELHERRVHSNKPEIVVNEPAKSKEDAAKSLDADQLVDNGVPLACVEPRPQEIEVHQDVDNGLWQQHTVHCIADQV